MIRAVLSCTALCLFLSACGGDKPEPQTPVDSGTHVLPTQNCIDNDADGVAGTGMCEGIVDCDDRNAEVYPGAPELCNDRDDNCDGQKDEGLTVNTWYLDNDHDGYGSTPSGQGCGAPPTGSVLQDGDCDDNDASRHPGATETCNNIDDDCDSNIDNNVTFQDFYADADGDTYGDANGTPVSSCMPTVQGRVTNQSDCDDSNPTVKPGATELCNRIDDNCDGQIDNGITYNDYYPDIDGDGFGDQYATPESSCSSVAGKVIDHTDCDDSRSTTKPNAPEQCNDIDDNCNSQVDEGLTFLTYYTDADGDGFGASNASPQSSCAAVAGKVTNNTDCNDANPAVKPTASEVCNGIDDNCDTVVDNGLTVYQYFTDADGDGYGTGTASPSCLTSRPGMVTNNTDCNDGNSAVHPGATEICNNVDDDCVGGVDNGLTFTTYYPDADGDTYGAATGGISACQAISGRVTNNSDCNDANAAIKPGATEVCDNIDNNCNTQVDEGLATSTYYPDNDHDGYGALTGGVAKCGPVGAQAGWVLDHTDCNDNSASVHPGAPEICGNGIDDNCVNGTSDEPGQSPWYPDNDGDGFGASNGTAVMSCGAVSGRAPNNSDCDDTNAAIKPGSTEVCDGKDNNCNSNIDEGIADGSSCAVGGKQGPCATGIMRCTSGAMACAQTVFPATEVCDSIDNNCDGTVDNLAATSCSTGQSGICSAGTTQCSGSNTVCVRTNNPTTETCNGLDDDCNGVVDNGNPGGGGSCVTGLLGVCSAGTNQCSNGTLSCVQTTQSSAETCDDLDNNCNGSIDEGFTGKGNACSVGVGVCLRSGTNICNAAHTGVVCSATAGPTTAPSCDGLDNDCDGTVDEPVMSSTSTISSAVYNDIEVKPFYYAGCQGGANSSGTDGLDGGAMVMGTGASGLVYQRLSATGAPVGATSTVFTYTYTDVDFAQAGDGYIVAGIWNSSEIDIAYVDVTGTTRVALEFAWDDTNTMDSLRVVRANGRKVTLLWRENTVGVKIAQVEACLSSGTWSFKAPGCASTTLPEITIAGTSTAVTGLGADSNVIDWAATQTCTTTTATRQVGVAYRSAANLLKYFTINDDGTTKSGETSFTPPANGTAEVDPDVGFFKDASNVDAYLVTFVAQFASTSDVYFWRSNNAATYYAAWGSSAATGASSITRTRVSAKSDGFQVAALRVFESEPTYPTQLMTRNYSLTGVASPSGTAVEIPVGCSAADSSCNTGNKAGLALHYPWSRLYYSSSATTSASFDSALTCN